MVHGSGGEPRWLKKRMSKTTKRVVLVVVVAACASAVLLDRFVGNGQCRELVPQIIELAKDEDTRIVSLGKHRQ